MSNCIVYYGVFGACMYGLLPGLSLWLSLIMLLQFHAAYDCSGMFHPFYIYNFMCLILYPSHLLSDSTHSDAQSHCHLSQNQQSTGDFVFLFLSVCRAGVVVDYVRGTGVVVGQPGLVS